MLVGVKRWTSMPIGFLRRVIAGTLMCASTRPPVPYVGDQVPLVSSDIRNWPGLLPHSRMLPERVGREAFLVVHRRDPRAGARPPRVWRGGAREVPVGYKKRAGVTVAIVTSSAAVPQRMTRFAWSARHALTNRWVLRRCFSVKRSG